MQERNEFLKEALLMMNFTHFNVIRLLGVCVETVPLTVGKGPSEGRAPCSEYTYPHFIILELMNEGDLLNYLRRSRPTRVSPHFIYNYQYNIVRSQIFNFNFLIFSNLPIMNDKTLCFYNK